MTQRRMVHAVVLALGALTFSYLPARVSGFPLEQLLSSDAEWYVTLTSMMAAPGTLAADRGFAYANTVKPGFENWLHDIVIALARASGSSLPAASVALSIAVLIVFVLLVYAAVSTTTGDDTMAFVIACVSIVPVHALAATTYGFQALGFLPRDLALTAAVAVLTSYFAAVRRDRYVPLVFLVTGVLANFYILVFAHLAAVMWMAEVFRRPVNWRAQLLTGMLFVAGAAPVIVNSLGYLGAATPVDVAIMRMRHPYMMIFPLGPALATTLRRVLVYVVVLPPCWWAIQRFGTRDEQVRLLPWMRVGLAALVITAAGVVIENTTTLWPYHISRTSVFFIFAAMVVCPFGIRAWARHVLGWGAGPVAIAASVALLLFQSNVPSVYRYVRDLRDTRQERLDVLAIASWLRDHTRGDEVVMAPTSVDRDTALTLRVYALRPVFVSFKDGGVSMMDGEKGRDWYARLQTQQRAFASPDASDVRLLMSRAGVHYAVVPVDSVAARHDGDGGAIAFRTSRFAVVRML